MKKFTNHVPPDEMDCYSIVLSSDDGTILNTGSTEVPTKQNADLQEQGHTMFTKPHDNEQLKLQETNSVSRSLSGYSHRLRKLPNSRYYYIDCSIPNRINYLLEMTNQCDLSHLTMCILIKQHNV
jgi:hypothetical protein